MSNWTIFISNLPAIICFIAGLVLAILGIQGWGWFLVVGILITVSFSKKEVEKENDQQQR